MLIKRHTTEYKGSGLWRRRGWNRLLMAVLSIVMILSCFSVLPGDFVKAKAITEPHIEISQIISIDGTPKNDYNDTFKYTLKSIEGTAPLPGGSTGEYTFNLTGNTNIIFDIYVTAPPENPKETDIYYTHAGVYKYKLTEEKLSEDDEFICENEEYIINVYIENGPDGLKFGCVEVLDKNGNKPSSSSMTIPFTNTYTGEVTKSDSDKDKPTPVPVKTPEPEAEPTAVPGEVDPTDAPAKPTKKPAKKDPTPKPAKTESGDHENDNKKKPKTGDKAALGFWLMVMILSFAGLLIIIREKNRMRISK